MVEKMEEKQKYWATELGKKVEQGIEEQERGQMIEELTKEQKQKQGSDEEKQNMGQLNQDKGDVEVIDAEVFYGKDFQEQSGHHEDGHAVVLSLMVEPHQQPFIFPVQQRKSQDSQWREVEQLRPQGGNVEMWLNFAGTVVSDYIYEEVKEQEKEREERG